MLGDTACVLHVAPCVRDRTVMASARTADIDILLAAGAEASVFKVSTLSSQPGVPEVWLRERGRERKREMRGETDEGRAVGLV